MPIFSKGLTKDKLLLLHLFDRTPYALSERQVYTILFETDSMPYFDFCEAFAQLCEDGYLSGDDAVSGQTYTLTPNGAEALSLFGESVPLSLRARVSDYETTHREHLQSAEQYLSKMQQEPDGGYTVQLMAAEGDRVLFCVTLSAATRELAVQMRRNWKAACPELYGKTLDLLLKE